MLVDFANAPVRRFTVINGRHPDGYTPLMLDRLAEFFDFYVARKIPLVNPAIRSPSPSANRISVVAGEREMIRVGTGTGSAANARRENAMRKKRIMNVLCIFRSVSIISIPDSGLDILCGEEGPIKNPQPSREDWGLRDTLTHT